MLNFGQRFLAAAYAHSGFAGSDHHADAIDGLLHALIGIALLFARLAIALQVDTANRAQYDGYHAENSREDI